MRSIRQQKREYLEQIAFYEFRRAGLGARYMSEVEAAIALICERPARFPVSMNLGFDACICAGLQ